MRRPDPRAKGRRRAAAAALLCGFAAGCARAPAGVARPGAPAPHPPPTPPASLAEAEPALLELEDRRAFDREALEAAAASPDPAVRSRAALALGRIGDEGGAPELARLLSDPSSDVRASAAFACAILGEASLTRDLSLLLADPDPAAAARAAWSLGFLEQPTGEEALLAALAAALAAENRAALLAALWHFPTPAAAAAAARYARDPDGRVRAAALYALARRPQDSSLGVLTGALTDPDPDTAALAARALGLLGHTESLPALLAVSDGPRALVGGAAMSAAHAILEKNPGTTLPPERAARLLTLSSDANPNLALPALVLLRWVASDRDVFRRLWSTASSGQGRRRQIALQSAMAGLKERSDALVDGAIESPEPLLRAAAAESLSFLPEPDAAQRRESLAADPEIVVRLKVLEGLRTEEAARSSRALVEASLSDPDPGIRAAAIEAFARLGDPATNERLRELVIASYGDREPDVSVAALEQASKQPASADARAVAEAVYRHPATLPSRLARRALVRTFRADPAEFPWREYVTGRVRSDYAAALTEARRTWIATVTTARGSFSIRLAGTEAPLTVRNFAQLAGRGFFDGLVVHRVVPNFVLQDGDPSGTGNGGPGYEIRDEINPLPYAGGTVGMALAGPDTGGSQWFVTHAAQPHLDGLYTVFGRISSGVDVVRRIEQGDRVLSVTVAAGRD